MDSTYLVKMKKLTNRLNGLKKEKAIYEYALNHVGEKVFKAQLMRQFKYYINDTGNTDNFIRTRLAKYIHAEPKYIPTRRGRWVTRYHRTIRDVLWLPAKVADSHRIKTIASKNPRWGYKLCFRETVPFWLLRQYGGPYSGQEFIYEIRRRIFDTQHDLRDVVGVLKEQMYTECPCENCICVPTCRCKLYITLTVDCALVNDYLFNHETRANDPQKELLFHRLQSVVDNLKPSKWDLNTLTNNAKKGALQL